MIQKLAYQSFWTCAVLSCLAGSAHADPFENWVRFQYQQSTTRMLKNISPPGAAAGAVVASPSRRDPDYFFHWIRDAALTEFAVVDLYENGRSLKSLAMKELKEYAHFSRVNQLTPNRSGAPGDKGLGEPKFMPDGKAFDGDWGRPQNDGPALRAITLIRLAEILWNKGERDYVRTVLYDGRIPTQTVIKADLEFISHHWRDASIDLWEETEGDHFYTRIVQRRALVSGAKLAEKLGDDAAARFYREEARALERELQRHWSHQKGYFLVTLNCKDGCRKKDSRLDVAILLGALHAYSPDDSFLSLQDEHIVKTVEALERKFKEIYVINEKTVDQDGQPMGPAAGRYPEDTYDGVKTDGEGNPWFLTTNALAEYYYRRAELAQRRGRLGGESGARALFAKGDEYLRRSRFHADPSGPLSEQFNRRSGHMQGARELTWSHASVITAVTARKKLTDRIARGRFR